MNKILFYIGAVFLGAGIRAIVPDQPRSVIATVLILGALIFLIQPDFIFK